MKESQCEEADMWIVMHLEYGLKSGYRNVQVRTSDTDVLVILIGHFYDLLNMFPGTEVEVDFGTEKNRTLYCVRTICMRRSCTDTTSAFRGKGNIFKSLGRYTVLLYDCTAETESINSAQWWLFNKKERCFETITY